MPADSPEPAPPPSEPEAQAHWGLKLAAALVIPALFFGLVDLVLLIAGVRPLAADRDPFAGFSGALNVFQRDDGRGVWATYDRATRQSFVPQTFLIDKPANGFRIFTLGGSAAIGFPHGPDQAFTRLLGDALQAAYPQRTVEAINAAAMSYASHRLRLLAGELVRHRPDVFIFYEGHNEFVERRFYAQAAGLARATGRASGLLAHWRLLALAWRAWERARPAAKTAAPTGDADPLAVDVVREKTLVANDAERQQVVRDFETNINAIADLARQAGVRLVLCTAPSNARDWQPNQSVLGADVGADARDRFAELTRSAERALADGDAARAAELYRQATALVPGHALTYFQLGRAYEALSRWDDARAAYAQARDHDAQPSRHVSAFSEALRRVAGQRGLLLVDAEALFEKASPHGLVGFNLIEDYSHPKPDGHRMIAAALYDALIRAGALGGPPVPPLTFDEAFARRRPAPAVVGESDRRAAMLYNTGYVLATQGHYQEAMEKYQACLEINPFYFAARLNLGVLRYGAGQIAESLRDFEEVLDYAPDNQQARVAKGWALMGLGRYAVEVFREATKHDPRDAQAWYGLGAAFQRQGGRAEDAEAAFRRAIELQPRYGDASCALGQLLLASRRTDEAVTRFEQCVDTRPQDSATRAWLGWALQMKGRREDAVAAYRVSLKLDPSNPYAKQGLAQMGGAAP